MTPLPTEPYQCPVCRARFRGDRVCSRCGADLGPLMKLAVRAWQLRQTAREFLEAGKFDQAQEAAISAQELQATPAGESLRVLTRWLGTLQAAEVTRSTGSAGE